MTASADVHVVDAVHGPYTTLAAAIGAAGDGDILLVEPGLYFSGANPVVDGISLEIIAADADDPPRVRPLSIVNLDAEDQVTVRGITFIRTVPPNFTRVVEITGNAGRVAFEDCRFQTSSAIAGQGQSLPAVDAMGGTGSVMFTRCTIQGADGLPPLGLGIGGMTAGEAIRADEQDILLFDSVVSGGKGGESEPGGDAIRLIDAQLHVSGGTVSGGAGGSTSTTSSCSDGGDGGDGIAGTGAVGLVGASVGAGAGGVALHANCSSGVPGTSISVAGSVTDYGGFATGVESTATTVVPGSAITLDFQGPDIPGGTVWLLQAQSTLGLQTFPGPPGVGASVLQTPASAGFGVILGGLHTQSFLVLHPWSGVDEGHVVHVQAIYLDPLEAKLYFGAPTHVTVVRGTFDPL